MKKLLRATTIALLAGFGFTFATLKTGPFPTQTDLDNALFSAIRSGNTNTTEIANLLKDGANVNATDEQGKTPLMKAVLANDLAFVKTLLKAKADLNKCDNVNCTALTWAVYKENLPIIKALLSASADPNKDEGHPLREAVAHNRLDIIKILLKAGANPSLGHLDSTPLIMAAEKGYMNVAQTLINAKANLNGQNYRGDTALIAALYNYNGTIAIGKMLIAAGANPNLSEYIYDNTPLMMAAMEGHVDVVRDLIAAGADTTLKNKDGKAALDYAATEEIKALLKTK